MISEIGYGRAGLDKIQVQILRCLKAKSRTEKQLSKVLRIDTYPLSAVITELMLLGYVETFHRRKYHFFMRKYCVITLAGLAALDQATTPFGHLVELVREKAMVTLDSVLSMSPALRIVRSSGKLAYGAYRFLK